MNHHVLLICICAGTSWNWREEFLGSLPSEAIVAADAKGHSNDAIRRGTEKVLLYFPCLWSSTLVLIAGSRIATTSLESFLWEGFRSCLLRCM
jgi:hypothetical protein